MAKCRQCGKEFMYNDLTGYAADICSSFCDGALSQHGKIAALTAERDRLAGEVESARTSMQQITDQARKSGEEIGRLMVDAARWKGAAERLQKELLRVRWFISYADHKHMDAEITAALAGCEEPPPGPGKKE